MKIFAGGQLWRRNPRLAAASSSPSHISTRPEPQVRATHPSPATTAWLPAIPSIPSMKL